MASKSAKKKDVVTCSCGSGKKYEHCCGSPAKVRARRNRQRLIVPLLVVAGIGVLLVLTRSDSRMTDPERAVSESEAVPGPSGTQASTVPRTPSGWYYDAEKNRHWDPAHKHWHDGPPPAGAPSGGSAAPAGAPAAWYYDAENDQHWDPQHNHWHDGPPPAGATGSDVGADAGSELEAIPVPESEESN